MLGDGRNCLPGLPVVGIDSVLEGGEWREGPTRVVKEFNATATMGLGKHATAEYNYKQYVREDVPTRPARARTANNAFDDYFIPREREGYADGAPDVSKKLETLFLDTRSLAADSIAEVFRGDGMHVRFVPATHLLKRGIRATRGTGSIC